LIRDGKIIFDPEGILEKLLGGLDVDRHGDGTGLSRV